MPDKRPYFPFYFRDFADDEKVKLMSWSQRGMYVALLSHQWAEGSIPSDLDSQLSLLGLEPGSSLAAQAASLAQCCFTSLPTDSSRLANAKLERVRMKHSKIDQQYHIRAVKGGLARQAQRRLNESTPQAQLKAATQISESEIKRKIPDLSSRARSEEKRPEGDPLDQYISKAFGQMPG